MSEGDDDNDVDDADGRLCAFCRAYMGNNGCV